MGKTEDNGHDWKKYRIKPGSSVHWKDFDTSDKGPFDQKEDALPDTESLIRKIDPFQERLYAEGKQSLLIILQGMDTGGKDGTIRHVMKEINPQGCQVSSFKQPSNTELTYDFLWRIHLRVPPKGYIGIFNRSHYEDVLVTRVHDVITEKESEKRYQDINDFERTLAHQGTTIVKFFLAISKEEQRKRLQARLDEPRKQWKFSPSDLTERAYWDKYQKVYAEVISATSTSHAPWFVIPANHEWYRNFLVAKILVETLTDMDPRFPPPPEGVDFKKLKIPG